MSVLEHEMKDREHPVAEDIQLQRKVWRIQRVGWYVLLAVVILTLLGLFSRGPLSSLVAISDSRDLIVEYERFHRSGGSNAMIIRTLGKPDQPVTVLIGKGMLEGFSIDSIQPQPMTSTSTAKGLALTLMADKQGDATLYLSWRSSGVGLFKSEVGIVGGSQIPVTQFIYP
ncbi:hypothetical protein V2I78_10520 [Pseudomonas viridiflava]|uniref:hypothetical protein n=1 Tax=Pseudomonas viridiflava TaxID=33069 RepID=UPI002ECCD595|nr:hypothetical protein [Pseudomonas viridiflava]